MNCYPGFYITRQGVMEVSRNRGSFMLQVPNRGKMFFDVKWSAFSFPHHNASCTVLLSLKSVFPQFALLCSAFLWSKLVRNMQISLKLLDLLYGSLREIDSHIMRITVKIDFMILVESEVLLCSVRTTNLLWDDHTLKTIYCTCTTLDYSPFYPFWKSFIGLTLSL